jgi:hypothetical protein
MIGNAVPVTLGEVIGRSITSHLREMYQARTEITEILSEDGKDAVLVA